MKRQLAGALPWLAAAVAGLSAAAAVADLPAAAVVASLPAAAVMASLPAAVAQPAATPPSGARSGYSFLAPETRAQQDDEFANPGMLWVLQGHRLWDDTPPQAKSCSGCHGDAGVAMRGVAARYPAFDPVARRVINLEQRINRCRVRHQQRPPLAYESQELLALSASVSRPSHGLPVAVHIDGPSSPSFKRGRAAYHRRRGQLDLSCADCHQQHAGARLGGETISQGQINGHPVYRHLWQALGSTHRMFAWCNTAVRAEPHAPGSQAYVDLELYVKWRGQGLPVETPAVRR